MEIRRFARRLGWFAVIGAGSLTMAGAMSQFGRAVTLSHDYDRIESEARGRAAVSRFIEPRTHLMLLRVLGNLREETHQRLAIGLFGAAGGMSLLALGQRGVRGQKRQDARPMAEEVACAGRDEFGLGGRCATIAGAPRRQVTGLRVAEPVDDEELALLARFEALERQVAASARG